MTQSIPSAAVLLNGIQVEDVRHSHEEKNIYRVKISSNIPFLPEGYFTPIVEAVAIYTKNEIKAESVYNKLIADEDVTITLCYGSKVLQSK